MPHLRIEFTDTTLKPDLRSGLFDLTTYVEGSLTTFNSIAHTGHEAQSVVAINGHLWYESGMTILSLDGTAEVYNENEHGMIELPHSGQEVTGSGGIGEYRQGDQIIYEYYNRNDVANRSEDQWGTPEVLVGLYNSIIEYRNLYPNDVIQIGDMRSPTDGRTAISSTASHHGNHGAIDVRYLGEGGSYRGRYNDSRFDSERNQYFAFLMGINGFTRVFVAPSIQNNVNSRTIRVIPDYSGVHNNHLHFDTD